MRNLLFLALSILMSCANSPKMPNDGPISYEFFVGTYTDKESRGIYKYELSEKGEMRQIALMAASKNPSFLVKSVDKKHLIAVNEISDENGMGSMESYSIQEDSLIFISRKSSGGAHPCFVSINERDYVLAANYTGGSIALLKLNKRGELIELDMQQHIGEGSTSRQKGPHAHSAWFSPINQQIISVDLGTNELWFSNIKNDKLKPSVPQKLAFEEGAGPRHLCFHPNRKWIYVLNELNGTITQIKSLESGDYKTISSVSIQPIAYHGESYPADIHISSDGRFVYASNRGPNEMAILEVELENGKLSLISQEPTRGNWPRNFSFSPDEKYLLVAHQYSDNITCFSRNSESGLLEFVSEVNAPSPVCILF